MAEADLRRQIDQLDRQVKALAAQYELQARQLQRLQGGSGTLEQQSPISVWKEDSNGQRSIVGQGLSILAGPGLIATKVANEPYIKLVGAGGGDGEWDIVVDPLNWMPNVGMRRATTIQEAVDIGKAVLQATPGKLNWSILLVSPTTESVTLGTGWPVDGSRNTILRFGGPRMGIMPTLLNDTVPSTSDEDALIKWTSLTDQPFVSGSGSASGLLTVIFQDLLLQAGGSSTVELTTGVETVFLRCFVTGQRGGDLIGSRNGIRAMRAFETLFNHNGRLFINSNDDSWFFNCRLEVKGGLEFSAVGYLRLLNSVVKGSDANGIVRASSAGNIIIANNLIVHTATSGTPIGVFLGSTGFSSETWVFTNNRVFGKGVGIGVTGSWLNVSGGQTRPGTIIANNIVSTFGTGIRLFTRLGTTDIYICTNNYIHSCSTGIEVFPDGFGSTVGRVVAMCIGNIIANATTGILFNKSKNGIIEGIYQPNLFENVTTKISGSPDAETSNLHKHVWQEVPSGTINGTNATFTLAAAPFPSTSLQLYKNGLYMRQGATEDYTISGSTITFNAGQIPQPGDTLIANYTTLF